MEIEFDVAKNEWNVRVRGLSFERVSEFDFRSAQFVAIEEHEGELRFVAAGLLGERVHVLCFTHRGTRIRVISFRKANRREVRHYEKAREAAGRR